MLASLVCGCDWRPDPAEIAVSYVLQIAQKPFRLTEDYVAPKGALIMPSIVAASMQASARPLLFCLCTLWHAVTDGMLCAEWHGLYALCNAACIVSSTTFCMYVSMHLLPLPLHVHQACTGTMLAPVTCQLQNILAACQIAVLSTPPSHCMP